MTGTNGSKHDINAHVPVKSSYIIASAPGSGSGRITTTLWQSNMAGAPKEYLNPLNIQDFFQRWQMDTFSEYVEKLKSHRASANGVFGIKTHFSHLRAVQKQCNLAELLPNLKYIYLSRRDRLEQAIALDFTLQNGFGNVTEARGIFEPRYSFERFEKAYNRLLAEERDWELFFRFNDIQPLNVYYDDFKDSPGLTLNRIFDFLEVSIEKTFQVDWPEASGYEKMRKAFVERFHKEKQRREIKSEI